MNRLHHFVFGLLASSYAVDELVRETDLANCCDHLAETKSKVDVDELLHPSDSKLILLVRLLIVCKRSLASPLFNLFSKEGEEVDN